MALFEDVVADEGTKIKGADTLIATSFRQPPPLPPHPQE